ncbi:hypothetical protein [Brevibacterium metallidurans]|uniref:Uncharacterized protein n=1 Tax=Brevibacterium metallidurans TaxID=1482676 RepID=A0ABN0SRS5_9MICO
MTNIKEITIEEVAEIVCSARGWRASGRSDSGVWLDVESGDLIAGPLWEPSQKSREIPLAEGYDIEAAFADSNAAETKLLNALSQVLAETVNEWKARYAEARSEHTSRVARSDMEAGEAW